jgi:hypothetical protein
MIFKSSSGKWRRRHRRLLLLSLFARMFVGGCRVLVSLFAIFVSRFGVLLRLFVLAKIMMMGCLMMMMCGRVVMRGRLMMMLTGRMLRGLCHGAVPPNRSMKLLTPVTGELCGSFLFTAIPMTLSDWRVLLAYRATRSLVVPDRVTARLTEPA